MNRGASPFSPRTLLALLGVGAAAFLLLLYAIGAGWDGSNDRNGGAHAAANGLNGYAGLVRLLEAQGHEVALSRTESRLQDPALLVLTPQVDDDGERLDAIIEDRRHRGPTLIILPKWQAIEASAVPALGALNPATMRSSVLLPQPDGPSSVTNSPSATASCTGCNARRPLG